MSRNRIIFYSVFCIYQVLGFVFAIVMENSGLTFQLRVASNIAVFKWVTLIGIILIIADFIWVRIDLRNQKKQQEDFRHENNILKAKVYDMQEGAKPKPKEELPKAN